jgi:single-strand DNA-binding protein
MNSLNSVLLEGNLVRDPEERRTSSDTVICSFCIAVNRSYKKDDDYVKEVSYFDIEVWAGLGEICIKNLTKGRGVRVVGRMKQDRWIDDKDESHSRIKVVAEHVEFKPQVNIDDKIKNEQEVEVVVN